MLELGVQLRKISRFMTVSHKALVIMDGGSYAFSLIEMKAVIPSFATFRSYTPSATMNADYQSC